MKLRLTEAHAESARKAEERITNESAQLRSEISRQGALIESIQRIEARLSAKTAADEESSKAQIAALSDKLTAQENKHSAEIEKLNNAASDQGIKIQEMEKEREKAVREALESKRDVLKVTTELQKLKKHCQTIEAQLKLAKKKLGDTGDGDDAEAELRSKVASLSDDLEAARKETESLKERAATFSKLAKDNEAALAELTEATNAAKAAQEEEVKTLKNHLDTAQSEATKTKEIVSELTNDLSSQREEREKAVQEVKDKISGMENEVAKYKKDAEAAESRHSQLQAEVLVLRADASNAQVRLYFIQVLPIIISALTFHFHRIIMNENSLYMPQQGQTFEQQKKKSTQRDDCAELQKNKLVALRVSSWNNGLYLIKKKCPWRVL